jgi:hypothetical protein
MFIRLILFLVCAGSGAAASYDGESVWALLFGGCAGLMLGMLLGKAGNNHDDSNPR